MTRITHLNAVTQRFWKGRTDGYIYRITESRFGWLFAVRYSSGGRCCSYTIWLQTASFSINSHSTISYTLICQCIIGLVNVLPVPNFFWSALNSSKWIVGDDFLCLLSLTSQLRIVASGLDCTFVVPLADCEFFFTVALSLEQSLWRPMDLQKAYYYYYYYHYGFMISTV